MGSRVRVLIGVAALPLVLFACLPLVSNGQTKDLGSKIERKRDQIDWRKGRERVLSSDISAYTHKISGLQADTAGPPCFRRPPRPPASEAR